MLIDRIHAYIAGQGAPVNALMMAEVGKLAETAFSQQFGPQEERKGTLRLSSIGQCQRKLAYGLLGFEPNGKELDARARMVFFAGQMAELAIVQLALLAGCLITDCGSSQREVFINDVPGHPDGILTHEGKKYLLEVKSMSSYGFKDFERGIIDDGYRYQINAYMSALSLDQAVIVALNKDAGVLHEKVIDLDPHIVADIHKRISTVKATTKETLPERPYAPDANGFLPFYCRYCAWFKTCWPSSELVLVKNSYKLHIPK